MKSRVKYFVLIFTLFGFLFNACNKSEDLVTADAKTGGLVTPTSAIPYKLGATPTVDITIDIPMGPGISSIKVFNQYYRLADTANSDQVLMKTIDVANGNVSEALVKNLSITYQDLITDILVETVPLPTDETLLPIGDYWQLVYISVMDDGSEVLNNGKTNIAVANIYAGTYQCVGVFHHPTAGDRPINEEKFLTPLSAYSCRTTVGDLGGSGYSMTITVDPTTNDVTYSAGDPAEIIATADQRSYYDPANGHFYLHYFYVGSTGNRVMDEEYTPL